MTGKLARMMATALLLLVTGGCVTAEEEYQTSAVVEDSAISAAVTRSLAGDPAARLNGVKVDTHNGTVYLSGVVDFWGQRIRAQELALRVPGVRKVVNQLEVRRD